MNDQIIIQFGYIAVWFFVGLGWLLVAGVWAIAMIATYGAMAETTKTARNAKYFIIWQRWLRRKRRHRINH